MQDWFKGDFQLYFFFYKDTIIVLYYLLKSLFLFAMTEPKIGPDRRRPTFYNHRGRFYSSIIVNI